MWNLDDSNKYMLVHSFEFPKALTWGDGDITKREYIRSQAAKSFSKENYSLIKAWAFRIYVWKAENQKNFDIENVPKLIVDAFSEEQLQKDKRKLPQITNLSLFEKDTIDYVKIVQVGGERSNQDRTRVEIFGCK